MPTAVIVGCSGQDGTYLSGLLEEKSYEIVGIGRGKSFGSVDISDPAEVMHLLETVQPREIYYLAAFHHSSEDVEVNDSELVRKSFEVHTLSLNNFLYGITQKSPRSRLFYAASCLVFGNPSTTPQDERTPMDPRCPYGISKAAGAYLCRFYREKRKVYCSVGILYNHESPLRNPQFISRKIAKAAVNIKRGLQDKLVLGDLDVRVDWGYAPDYVAAMWGILQLDQPDDFIIASGTFHTVRELVQTAFDVVGLRWEDHVVEDPSLLKRNRPATTLQGTAEKLTSRTGWRPQVSFTDMVRKLVLAEMTDGEVSDEMSALGKHP